MFKSVINFVWSAIMLAGAGCGLYVIHSFLVYIGYADSIFGYLG